MSYGSATVPCPHCSKPSTHEIKMRDGGQIVSCPSCHKNFRIKINQGQVQGTSDR
jgi:transposase-like protein